MTFSGSPSRKRCPSSRSYVCEQRPCRRATRGTRSSPRSRRAARTARCPVSNLRPTGIDAGRPRLVRPPRLEQLVPAVGEPEVRAAELVRRAEEDVAAERLHVDRLVRRVVHGVDPARARRRRARARRRAATSVIVPTAFDATTHATTRTRSSSFRSRSSRSRRRSSVTSIQSTSKPRSAASSTHGATPPSWSSRETRIRSPSLPVA